MKNRDLGFACRFGTLDEVKALVERGANFKCENETESEQATSVERGTERKSDYSLMIIDDFPLWALLVLGEDERKLSPIHERLKIAEYLFARAERVGLFPERLLYFSIRYDCGWLYELLKKRGTSLSDEVKRWRVEHFFADTRNPIGSYRLSVREIGLELFDKFTKNKMNLLRYLIDNDATDCLAQAEPYGWFKQPSKLQKLIAYAAENKKIQCAAWLLDYSNRARK